MKVTFCNARYALQSTRNALVQVITHLHKSKYLLGKHSHGKRAAWCCDCRWCHELIVVDIVLVVVVGTKCFDNVAVIIVYFISWCLNLRHKNTRIQITCNKEYCTQTNAPACSRTVFICAIIDRGSFVSTSQSIVLLLAPTQIIAKHRAPLLLRMFDADLGPHSITLICCGLVVQLTDATTTV